MGGKAARCRSASRSSWPVGAPIGFSEHSFSRVGAALCSAQGFRRRGMASSKNARAIGLSATKIASTPLWAHCLGLVLLELICHIGPCDLTTIIEIRNSGSSMNLRIFFLMCRRPSWLFLLLVVSRLSTTYRMKLMRPAHLIENRFREARVSGRIRNSAA